MEPRRHPFKRLSVPADAWERAFTIEVEDGFLGSTSADFTLSVLAPPTPTGGVFTVTGTSQVGQTVFGAQLPDDLFRGSRPFHYDYQWFRCDAGGASCAPIEGASARSYVIASAELEKTLRLRYTASNAVGSASADSAAFAVVKGRNPVFDGTISLVGTPHVGNTLTVGLDGDWSADEPVTLSYIWIWARSRVPGGPSLTLTSAMLRSSLAVTVTATTPSGAAGWRSTPTVTVGAAEPPVLVSPRRSAARPGRGRR